MKIKLLTFILLLTITIISCSEDEEPMINEEEPIENINCETKDMSFQNDISVIFGSNCLGCHSTEAAFANIILDTYAGVKATVDNNRLLGAIQHKNGFSAMPQGGNQLSDCNIDQIDSWIEAGATDN